MEDWREEGGRLVAGPALDGPAKPKREGRRYATAILALGLYGAALFAGGFGTAKSLEPTLTESIVAEGPCLVQAIGTSGDNENLAVLMSNVRASAPPGAEVEFLRVDLGEGQSYLAVVGKVCPPEEASADRMEGV